MRYYAVSMLSGCAWFVVAGLAGYAIPVFGEMWFPHLVDAVVTGLVTGILIKPLLLRCHGTRNWYAVPFLSVFLGMLIFGWFIPVSWQIAALINGNGGVDAQAFYQIPLMVVLYSMTAFLPIFYPLALLNNRIVYRFAK